MLLVLFAKYKVSFQDDKPELRQVFRSTAYKTRGAEISTWRTLEVRTNRNPSMMPPNGAPLPPEDTPNALNTWVPKKYLTNWRICCSYFTFNQFSMPCLLQRGVNLCTRLSHNQIAFMMLWNSSKASNRVLRVFQRNYYQGYWKS